MPVRLVRWFGGAGMLGAFVLWMVGCTIEPASTETGPRGGAGPSAAPSSPSAVSSATSRGASAAGAAPLIVRVDADRTLTAAPGEGVGVFVEYQTGGHWHVWWTCDANVTQRVCNFRILVTPTAGGFANGAASGLSPADTFVAGADRLDVVTETSGGAPGLTFDAVPGTGVQIDATVNEVRDGALFFFVQGGVVNGGYAGPLSDPLVFEP